LALTVPATAQESPAPTIRAASGFVRPFEYAIPAGWEPNVIIEDVPVLLLAEADAGYATLGTVQRPESGSRGVLVADVTGGYIHGCGTVGGSGRTQVGEGSEDVLIDIQAIGGLEFDDIVATTLDGRPAVAAVSSSRGRCGTGDIHLDGLPSFQDYILLDVPSRLTLVEVDGRTIMVQAWAFTELDLEEFLPTAEQFIDSIHFLENEEPAEDVTLSPSAEPG
jgi:hypothetical protein